MAKSAYRVAIFGPRGGIVFGRLPIVYRLKIHVCNFVLFSSLFPLFLAGLWPLPLPGHVFFPNRRCRVSFRGIVYVCVDLEERRTHAQRRWKTAFRLICFGGGYRFRLSPYRLSIKMVESTSRGGGRPIFKSPSTNIQTESINPTPFMFFGSVPGTVI